MRGSRHQHSQTLKTTLPSSRLTLRYIQVLKMASYRGDSRHAKTSPQRPLRAQLRDRIINRITELKLKDFEAAEELGLSSGQISRFPRYRVLIAVALKDAATAEAAATDMLAEPLEPWRHRMEDTHALRIWSQSGESSPALAHWIDSDNPSLSATALSLVANG